MKRNHVPPNQQNLQSIKLAINYARRWEQRENAKTAKSVPVLWFSGFLVFWFSRFSRFSRFLVFLFRWPHPSGQVAFFMCLANLSVYLNSTQWLSSSHTTFLRIWNLMRYLWIKAATLNKVWTKTLTQEIFPRTYAEHPFDQGTCHWIISISTAFRMHHDGIPLCQALFSGCLCKRKKNRTQNGHPPRTPGHWVFESLCWRFNIQAKHTKTHLPLCYLWITSGRALITHPKTCIEQQNHGSPKHIRDWKALVDSFEVILNILNGKLKMMQDSDRCSWPMLNAWC